LQGYDNTWHGQRVNSSPPPPSQAQSQSQGTFLSFSFLSAILSALVVTTMVVVASPTLVLAKKSSEYKQGFKDGQAAETADEKTSGGQIPKNNHQCNGTFDYCNGFADGYPHQIEVSFPELNLD
jgi:hypothetical protein